ncbi:hypothetical protein [Salimicrobium humidisoli]|uniref:hypothetical protein n=1 Tax=Salimicrobium humidisoli TaxID=2029857 RepID=UPI00117A6E6E|nr:hypothetical protein [Salimicrobium humidisoli]
MDVRDTDFVYLDGAAHYLFSIGKHETDRILAVPLFLEYCFFIPGVPVNLKDIVRAENRKTYD